MDSVNFKESKQNKDIEVLRAYSILMVLFEHSQGITRFANLDRVSKFFNGWVGVDLFFCISGFVIFRSLSARLQYAMPRHEAIREGMAFWIRRFWRLAPAAWLWIMLGFALILSCGEAEAVSVANSAADALAALFNFMNFHQHACNVEGDACGKLFSPYWSLSLETQFYLVLPFLMILLPRRWLSYGLLLLIAAQFTLHRPANSVEIGWFIRTDAIAWGVLIAQLAQSPIRSLVEPRFLGNRIASAVFTLMLVYMLGASPLFWREDFFVGLLALICAILVFAASYDRGYIARLFGANGVLLWIGARSFSLYVAHAVVFLAARKACLALGLDEHRPGPRAVFFLVAYVATFAAAALTYRYVENPLRRFGRRQTALYLAGAASAAPAPQAVRLSA